MPTRGSSVVDWSAAVTLLADRAADPILLMDSSGRVAMMNTAFEDRMLSRHPKVFSKCQDEYRKDRSEEYCEIFL